ncbi:cation transporter [Arsenicitalea aurantiaca]|uniref:Cation transporter n=1 Tax=Arsenicitalea aurantiaca TaxID=1783274 RepID=A0A433X3Z5_9HYPH|nr:cation transporter [Arsenicitalea aurantiaca]RUT28786.1 cation transporter [Arsenicitalea aurantiaca]
MSAGCGHEHSFDGMDDAYKRRLVIVTILNLLGFAIEMSAGALSGSQALKADALDFLADGATYALSLWAIGRPLQVRAGAAFAKGLSLVAIGLWIAGSTLYQVFYMGMPEPHVMSIVGLIALGINFVSVWLLMAYKDGDANVRSVWLCSRNDMIGNIAVVGAAGAVAVLGNGAPDLIVAFIMSALFLSSAGQILRQSATEWQRARSGEAVTHDHEHDHGHSH